MWGVAQLASVGPNAAVVCSDKSVASVRGAVVSCMEQVKSPMCPEPTVGLQVQKHSVFQSIMIDMVDIE